MNYETITKELKAIDPYLIAGPIPVMCSGRVVVDGMPLTISYRTPGVRITRQSQIWHGMGWTIWDFRANETLEQIKTQIRKLDRTKLGINGEIAVREERRKKQVVAHRKELANEAAKDIYNSLNKSIY